MSMAPYDQKNMLLNKNNFHHRNGSDELDVFQATQYFASEEKPSSVSNLRPIISSQKERGQPELRRVGRMSLDLPINTRNSSINSSPNDDDDHDHGDHLMDKKQAKTPGRKLARFFSSLFNVQTSSNQRKTTMKDSKLSTKQRRSSMSNFRSDSSHNHDSKSIYSSSSSETPSKGGYINSKDTTTTRIRTNNSNESKEFARPPTRTLPLPLPSKIMMPAAATSTIICGESKVFEYANWLDEMNLKVDYRNINGLISEKKNKFQDQEILKPNFNKVEDKLNLRVIDDDDDGAESDSSSDLFELQNYDVLRVL